MEREGEEGTERQESSGPSGLEDGTGLAACPPQSSPVSSSREGPLDGGGRAPAGWAGVGALVHMQTCSVDPLNLQLPGRGGWAERWDFCWPRGNAEGVLSCIHHSPNKRLLNAGLSSGPPHPLGRAPEVPAWPALPASPVSDLAASCPVMPLPWPLWPSCSLSPAPRPGPFSPPLHSALSI